MKTGLVLALATTVSVALLLLMSNKPQNCAPIKVVDHVDLQKYMGLWYQQALIPFIWELGCENTTATYSFNPDGTIKVDNVCYKCGKFAQMVAKAYPDPKDQNHTNAKLKIQGSDKINITSDYWIVRLADDYSYSVVSGSTRRYLWILSRDKIMDPVLYDSIVADLKRDGFWAHLLKKTKQ